MPHPLHHFGSNCEEVTTLSRLLLKCATVSQKIRFFVCLTSLSKSVLTFDQIYNKYTSITITNQFWKICSKHRGFKRTTPQPAYAYTNHCTTPRLGTVWKETGLCRHRWVICAWREHFCSYSEKRALYPARRKVSLFAMPCATFCKHSVLRRSEEPFSGVTAQFLHKTLECNCSPFENGSHVYLDVPHSWPPILYSQSDWLHKRWFRSHLVTHCKVVGQNAVRQRTVDGQIHQASQIRGTCISSITTHVLM